MIIHTNSTKWPYAHEIAPYVVLLYHNAAQINAKQIITWPACTSVKINATPAGKCALIHAHIVS